MKLKLKKPKLTLKAKTITFKKPSLRLTKKGGSRKSN